MSKKFPILILAFCIMLFASFSMAKTNITILVDNTEIYSDVKPFISNDTTYVPLRFVSQALRTDSILWDQNTKCVTIKKDSTTLNFFINKNYAFVNNVRRTINGTPLIKNNRTFVPLRIISENLDATVEWNASTNTIVISTKKATTSTQKPSTPTTSSKPSNSNNTNSSLTYAPYDTDAIYWLSRIIEAEASGEPYNGKVAVGEVILNRVKSNEFPNTIWEVIFDDKFGIQFEPVANGTIYNTPSEESIKAAKEALSGSTYSKNSLYFLNPRIASSNWITRNRKYCMTIANHDFYL